MTAHGRLLWLGMAVLGLLYGSPRAGNACSIEAGGPLYDRPLYNDELTVALPKDWRVVKTEPPGILKYDDLLYYVQLGNRRLFGIDLSNNNNVQFPEDTTTSAIVTAHGMSAMEYRRDGVLTSVIVKAPCGGFQYVWMWRITKEPGDWRQVEKSMQSINCLASPRPRL